MTGIAFDIKPQWTVESLRQVVFAPRYLFALCDDADPGHYMVSPGRQAPDLVQAKHDVVAAYAGLGIVDAQGEPCAALSSLLAPIRSCRIWFDDGDAPKPGEEDRRGYGIAFGEHAATLVRRTRAADQQGFTLVGLGGPAEWVERVFKETGLDLSDKEEDDGHVI